MKTFAINDTVIYQGQRCKVIGLPFGKSKQYTVLRPSGHAADVDESELVKAQ